MPAVYRIVGPIIHATLGIHAVSAGAARNISILRSKLCY